MADAREDAIEAVKAILLRDATNMHRTSPVEVVDAVWSIIEAEAEAHNRCHCTSCIVAEECLADGCRFDRSMAELRGRIALEIEVFHAEQCGGPESPWSYVCTCKDAARIARGGESDG